MYYIIDVCIQIVSVELFAVELVMTDLFAVQNKKGLFLMLHILKNAVLSKAFFIGRSIIFSPIFIWVV